MLNKPLGSSGISTSVIGIGTAAMDTADYYNNADTKKAIKAIHAALDEGVADLHPIFPARKLHRKWRTDALKKGRSEERKCPVMRVQNLWKRTMRPDESVPELWNHAVTCPALHAIMDSGYIIPAPADFIINMDGELN